MSNKKGIPKYYRDEEEDEEADNFQQTRPIFQASQRPIREAYGLPTNEPSLSIHQTPKSRGQIPKISLDRVPEDKRLEPLTSAEKIISLSDSEALDIWKNMRNIDRFLEQVYHYFYGKGLRVIMISKITNLITTAFVIAFSLVLLYCVDWNLLAAPATASSHPKLFDVLHLSKIFRLSFFMFICVTIFFTIWSWKAYKLISEFGQLFRLKKFFNKVLLINDTELTSYNFKDIINKLIVLQQRLPASDGSFQNAHDIVSRLMRRENYLIALFNKDVIDLTLPFSKNPVLTKLTEWFLSFSILTYFFDESLVVKRAFLKDINRATMVDGLRKRFKLLAFISFILSPFLFVFSLIYFIFKYGEEVYKNPKIIGNREYTTYARWKLREFHELPHLFEQRLANSHSKAAKYMEQFHNATMAGVGKFISFVTGSLCFVMILLTAYNEDLLMHFEITPGKSIIWYLALFGAILAISRSMIPDVTRTRDPERLMKTIAEYTHYMPNHWKDRLRSEEVRSEFGRLYQYQILSFTHELLSVFTTPILLWFVFPKQSERIVDFFREFTVHVDGIGYVCSFGLFDFKRHGNPNYGSVISKKNANDKYYRSKQGKMEKSFINFASNYPDWTPDAQGSMYLDRLKEFDASQSMINGKESRFFRSKKSLHMHPGFPDSDEDIIDENHGLLSLLNDYYDHNRLEMQP